MRKKYSFRKVKKQRRIWLYSILIVVFAILIESCISDKDKINNMKTVFVPNDSTAIKIAEAIWHPIYGNEIYEYLPFKAELINGLVWKVSGTVPAEKGGGPFIEINKNSCEIKRVYFQK